MHAPEYHFRARWHLDAPYDEVFDVLADLEHYPQWWPAVRKIVPVDEETAGAYLRSRLPYTLVCTLTRETQDREHGALEVRLAGDLHGYARWVLFDAAGQTTGVYEQRVTARRASMRFLAPAAGPLFRLNHRWMMQDGLDGLRRRLAR